MPMAEDILDLEAPELLQFQRFWWIAHRVGWLLLAIVIVAGLLGFLGPGLLSKASTGDRQLLVEYDRFLRSQSPTRLRILLPVSEGGLGFLWIDPAYLNEMDIEQIIPEPVRTEVREQWIVHLFRTDPGGRATVTVHARPRSAGPIRGHLGSGPSTVEFRQFIFP